MTRRRWGAFGALLVFLVAAAALALIPHRRPESAEEKPPLALLTSLPILFGEGFGLNNTGSATLEALSARFTVKPISTTSTQELRAPLLFMAQPQAQTAENLVALDNWVRGGGRVLLLADPQLEWPSERPLGDPLRPPPMYPDTGLLGHWKLRLDAPDQRGPAQRTLAGRPVLTRSPGALYGGCVISADRFVADCRIGKGRAVVVADADLLDVTDLSPGAGGNLRAVVDLLESMANR